MQYREVIVKMKQHFFYREKHNKVMEGRNDLMTCWTQGFRKSLEKRVVTSSMSLALSENASTLVKHITVLSLVKPCPCIHNYLQISIMITRREIISISNVCQKKISISNVSVYIISISNHRMMIHGQGLTKLWDTSSSLSSCELCRRYYIISNVCVYIISISNKNNSVKTNYQIKIKWLFL